MRRTVQRGFAATILAFLFLLLVPVSSQTLDRVSRMTRRPRTAAAMFEGVRV